MSDLIQIEDKISDVLDTIGNADNNYDKPQIAPAAILIDNDDSDGESIPYVGESDGETIPYVGESDSETIPYLGGSDTESVVYAPPYRNTSKRDEVYRKHAKKKALKILAKKRAKKLKAAKEINKKTNILVPTDVTITTDAPIEILANPNVSTILPPVGNNDVTLMKTMLTLILTIQE